MLRVSGAAALASLFLSGCSEPPVTSTEQALLGLTYEAVVADLRDPTSVEFTDVVWIDTTTATAVCGKFNARNGFGGMSGRTAFVRRFLPEEIDFARKAVGKRRLEYDVLRQRAVAALAVHSYDQEKIRPTKPPVLYREGDFANLATMDNAAIHAGCYDATPTALPLAPLPRTDGK